MRLSIEQNAPGQADGTYRIQARGHIAAVLYWADRSGPLPDWLPLAALPIPPNGTASCVLSGGRAVPPEATHVLLRTVSADLQTSDDLLVPLPLPARAEAAAPDARFLVMSDLHLSSKPWQVRRTLAMGRGYDGVLIAGDLTNDGTPDQLQAVWSHITELLPDTPVFAVAGNHDYPVRPLPQVVSGICSCPILLERLLERNQRLGWDCTADSTGAYAAKNGDLEIIGLHAVSHFRRFLFPGGRQLDWLERHLSDPSGARRIVLCHAPLFAHRPCPRPKDQPYLNRDKALQRILDAQSNVIFLSGHTHLSLNCRRGCAEQDIRGNVYFNAGSIRPTTLMQDEPLQPRSWALGNTAALELFEDCAEFRGISMEDGRFLARGFYRFPVC